MTLIGIDLGTTYSAIARLAGDRVEILANEEGNLLTPSIVYLPDANLEQAVVGEIAGGMLATKEKNNVVRWTKRLTGAGQNVKMRKNDGEMVEFTPSQIFSAILKKLKKDAEIITGEQVAGAVVTVPAWFNVDQCREVMEAGEIAQLNILQLVPEPQAATVDYALDQNLDIDDKKIFVYDLGGGTFDAILIDVQCSISDDGSKQYTFVEIAKEGSRELGGYDWDKQLIEDVCRRFDEKHGTESLLDAGHDLEMDGEKVKKTLSKVDTAYFNLRVGDIADSIEVHRENFERLTSALLEQTRTKVKQTLQNGNCAWQDIDYVLLVGGSTNMPMVSAMLRDELGPDHEHKLHKHKGVDFNVARGAGYIAAGFVKVGDSFQKADNEEKSQEVQLPNIVVKRRLKAEDAIGVTGIRQDQMINAVILPAGNYTGEEHSRVFPLAEDNMTEVVIIFNQGDSENLEEVAQEKGRLILSDLPAGRPAGCKVEISLSLDENGLLAARARDLDTALECDIAIQMNL